MPDDMRRLTVKQYLKTHNRLRRLWLHNPAVFAEVSPNDQWLLHGFFVPDRELTDLELLTYRDRVTEQRPSLPHQAGKALTRVWEAAAHAGLVRVRRAKVPVGATKHVRQADRHLVVKPLVRPEIDVHKLARAIVWMAPERDGSVETTSERPESPAVGVTHPGATFA